MKRLDFARLRAAQRDSATSEVKSLLILDRIADAEQIGVSDQELNIGSWSCSRYSYVNRWIPCR